METTYSPGRDPNNTVSTKCGNGDEAETRNVEVATYGANIVSLWPPEIDDEQFSPKDIASHLAKIVYFPESAHAPFTAAQYGIELATALKHAGPLIQLHGLLSNAHEAYLGHVPPAARLAEKAMTRPPLVADRRDELEESMQIRIMAALGIPDFGQGNRLFSNAIDYERERLHATLRRDIGAWIIRFNPDAGEPLPRIITPKRWDHAIEAYVRLYGDLTAHCGLKVKG